MRLRALLFACALPLFAGEWSLETLIHEPSGRPKDFFLLRVLQESPSKSDATLAFFQTQKPKPEHLKAYGLIADDPALSRYMECRDLSVLKIPAESPECVALGLSYSKASRMSSKPLLAAAQKVRPLDPEKAETLEIMADPRPFVRLKQAPARFAPLFVKVGATYRREYLNHPWDIPMQEALVSDPLLGRVAEIALLDSSLRHVRHGLLAFPPSDVSQEAAGFIALIAVGEGKNEAASLFFQTAETKAYRQIDRDMATFWQWLLSRDRALLEQTAKSGDINIYSLLARELLGESYPDVQATAPAYGQDGDLLSPFAWDDMKGWMQDASKETLKIVQTRLGGSANAPHRALIQERMDGFTNNFFLMPYAELLKGLSDHEKALMWALGRQESHFIPQAISHAYAVGVMQLMPFLIEEIAGRKREKVNVTDFFDPVPNLDYASYHLQWIRRKLDHPLFIAYAYNGGLGFTTRMLKRGHFSKATTLKKQFYAIETVPFSESRYYGKRVLANYVVYRKLLGNPVTLRSLFETLRNPSGH